MLSRGGNELQIIVVFGKVRHLYLMEHSFPLIFGRFWVTDLLLTQICSCLLFCWPQMPGRFIGTWPNVGSPQNNSYRIKSSLLPTEPYYEMLLVAVWTGSIITDSVFKWSLCTSRVGTLFFVTWDNENKRIDDEVLSVPWIAEGIEHKLFLNVK